MIGSTARAKRAYETLEIDGGKIHIINPNPKFSGVVYWAIIYKKPSSLAIKHKPIK